MQQEEEEEENGGKNKLNHKIKKGKKDQEKSEML